MLKKEIKKNAEILKALNNAYIDDYKHIIDKDKRESRERLKPGEVAPAHNGIILAENKELLKTIQIELKNKAYNILNDIKAQIDKEKTKAPSNEAIQYIDLLRKRTSINRDDIDLALKTYGDNYQVDKAVLDIATENEIDINGIGVFEDIVANETNSLFYSYAGIIGHENNFNDLGVESVISSLNQEVDALSIIE